ncbi:hypothetical protein B0G73_1121, partial [Paraburkholderia sp. BL25I1N1]
LCTNLLVRDIRYTRDLQHGLSWDIYAGETDQTACHQP